MKTYTHSNGNTYNVSINGEFVTLTSVNGNACNMYITLSDFEKVSGYKADLSVNDVKVGDKIRAVYRYGRSYKGTVTAVVKNKVAVELDFTGVSDSCRSRNTPVMSFEKFRITDINGTDTVDCIHK